MYGNLIMATSSYGGSSVDEVTVINTIRSGQPPVALTTHKINTSILTTSNQQKYHLATKSGDKTVL